MLFFALFDFRIGAFGLKRTDRTVLVRGTRGARLNFSFWIMRGNHVAVQRRLFLGQLYCMWESERIETRNIRETPDGKPMCARLKPNQQPPFSPHPTRDESNGQKNHDQKTIFFLALSHDLAVICPENYFIWGEILVSVFSCYIPFNVVKNHQALKN